jgi:DNA topoisomerase-1
MRIAAAGQAELVYVTTGTAGIRRRRRGAGFAYLDPAGKPVRCPDTLARIRALVIPPAWADVWICPEPCGHLQALGVDAKGRRQYRYHPRWRADRDGTKFGQLVAFGEALPRLRARVATDLGKPGLPREKVLAAVGRLLDRTHLRVGNAEYARANKSFGLSTLRDKHVTFAGDSLRLTFRGKSGVWHDRKVSDHRLARTVRACRDLPGQHLFQYLDEVGDVHAVGSAVVNEYLKEATGGPFTAKVFRTWAGTVAATVALADEPPPASAAAAKRTLAAVVRRVADELGNTPAVCRASYIHPRAVAAFTAGGLELPVVRKPPAGLTADEARVLRFLRA